LTLRNLVRQPRRSLSTIAGVLASMVLIVVARGLEDTVDSLTATLVRSVFREDLRVDFVPWTSGATVGRVSGWAGVRRAEGELALPVEMRKGSRTYEGMAVGIGSHAVLREPVDAAGRPVRPSPGWAGFGPTLRLRLGLEQGDRVWVRRPPTARQPDPRWWTVRVAGFGNEAVGTFATFDRETLRGTLGRGMGIPSGAVNAVRVLADPGVHRSLRRDLLRLDGAVSVMTSADLLGKLEQMMALMRRFTGAMLLFGAGLAFASVFNTVVVNVLEREVESATLRMLGLGRWSLALSFVAENVLLAGAGVLAGVPIGRVAAEALILAAQSEEQMDMFAMMPFIRPQTPWLAGALVLVATLVSVVPAIVRLSRLNLAASAKQGAR